MADKPVARKVKFATVATYIGSTVGLAFLDAVTRLDLPAVLPDALAPFVVALFPAAVALLGGYQAKSAPQD